MIKMGSFRSYVGLDEYEMKIPRPVGEAFLQPNFLGGELVIAEAHNVLKFTSLSKKNGVSGSLYVTNARLVFVSSDHVGLEVSVPLLSIHTLWHYEDEKRKVKHKIKLTPSGSQSSALFSSGSTRIYEIFVVCANFMTLNVSFKFSPIDHGKKICNAILHHAIPDPLERLFYFDFCKVTVADYDGGYNRYSCVPYFDVALDWHKELKFTRAPSYRVTDANEAFAMCETLPEWFVVPASINDARLSNLAERLKGSRPPFWIWGDSHGAAIIRMGKLHNEAESSSENAFFEILRKSHPEKKPPQIVDLESILPIKEIKQSFHRLLELCCPESLSQYEESDSRFLSLLEHTKWMWWVSRAIQVAGDVAEMVAKMPETVILQEHESRDVSCLIGSVVQLIVDPRFRTAIGLFSLIQKDWIATGHPFHSGYLHTSPIFLLFLDVVFQLCTQNPFQFEFNELLLTEIWDAVFDATSGTFLFDSPKQRKNMELRKDLSVWHKVLQKNASQVLPKAPDTFSGKANMVASSSFLFPGSANFRPTLPAALILPQLPQRLVNPMYKIRALLYPPTRDGQNNPYLLACSSSMCDVQLWASLYLNKTLEPLPAIGLASGGISSPIVLKPNEPYFPTTSKSRVSSTSSSSPMETTSFIYNTEASKAKTGRDPATELKLVDVLLSTLTSANRYHRNPHYSNNFNSSRAKGPSVPPRINPFSTNSTNL